MSDDTNPVADESSLDDLAERDDLADEAEAADEADLLEDDEELPTTNPATAMRKSSRPRRPKDSPGPVCWLRYCPRWR